MDHYWDTSAVHHHPMKYESENGVNYPFAPETGGNSYGNAPFSEDDAEFAPKRVKPTRQDPLSHRIIEKRRRDRMNSCLADLSRLIPPQYQRKSRGRIEKTEIIEMAIKHIKNIQAKATAVDSVIGGPEPSSGGIAASRQCAQMDQYKEGYHECLVTAVQYLLEISAHFEDICLKMANHLKGHFNDVMKGDLCTNPSSKFSHNLLGSFKQMKMRQQDNGSPPTTTTGGGLNQFLLANGVALTEGRGGGQTVPTGPRIAHLSGSMNGHSSSAVGGGLKNGGPAENGGCGGTNCEGVPSSSDGQEMNCAKDLSCRGANNNKNNISSAQAATTSTNTSNAAESGLEVNGVVGGCRKAPQQTPVITSTASTSACSSQTADLLVHAETESSCSIQDHGMDASLGGVVGVNGNGLHAGNLVKVHNLTDTSCDGVEHHYKYKNYMQQRFSHERFHDEHVVSNSSNELHDHHDHAMPEVGPVATVPGAGNRIRESMAPPAAEHTDSNCSEDHFVAFNAKRAATIAALEAIKNGIGAREDIPASALLLRDHPAMIKEEKMDTSTSDAVPRMIEGNQQTPRLKNKSRMAAVPVPIFALHSHGAFYIPLTVDYEALVPYLGEVSLFDKNMATVKALHPVNINIYAPF